MKSELDILAEIAHIEADPLRAPATRKIVGSGRRFPVYIARPRNRLDHCGHQHDTPSRALNCAGNHHGDWIALEARANGDEREIRT